MLYGHCKYWYRFGEDYEWHEKLIETEGGADEVAYYSADWPKHC